MLEEIKKIINSNPIGNIELCSYETDYKGVISEYYLIYKNGKISLLHEFVCRFLDFYGDDLYERYEYEFSNLEEVLNYVENKLNTKLKNMQKLFNIKLLTQFDHNDEEKKNLEEIWKKFQKDFKSGLLLDRNLKLL